MVRELKDKHLKMRFAQVNLLAKMSPCSRRQFGALIINPHTNSTVSEGYNGLPRGCETRFCGGEVCLRDSQNIISGLDPSVGCHHAEANSITNAARLGTPLDGCWLIVNGEPCLACAKLIHHAGISRVICLKGGYSSKQGIGYLQLNGVVVEFNAP